MNTKRFLVIGLTGFAIGFWIGSLILDSINWL